MRFNPESIIGTGRCDEPAVDEYAVRDAPGRVRAAGRRYGAGGRERREAAPGAAAGAGVARLLRGRVALAAADEPLREGWPGHYVSRFRGPVPMPRGRPALRQRAAAAGAVRGAGGCGAVHRNRPADRCGEDQECAGDAAAIRPRYAGRGERGDASAAGGVHGGPARDAAGHGDAGPDPRRRGPVRVVLLRGVRGDDRAGQVGARLCYTHAPAAARPGERAALVRLLAADDRLRERAGGRGAGPAVRLSALPAAGPAGAGAGPGGGVPLLHRGPAGADASQSAPAQPGAFRDAAGRERDADGGGPEDSTYGVPVPEAGGGDASAAPGADAARPGPSPSGAAAGPASARRPADISSVRAALGGSWLLAAGPERALSAWLFDKPQATSHTP